MSFVVSLLAACPIAGGSLVSLLGTRGCCMYTFPAYVES